MMWFVSPHTGFDNLKYAGIEAFDAPIHLIDIVSPTHDQNRVDAYLKLLCVGSAAPPIEVESENGRLKVFNGQHRLLAARLFGAETIRAVIARRI
jgi:hypothetical protein